tara:strand:+ start:267 stop:983 length:717 start_codon:yes stop_codon:yes gene_type:complete
MKKIIIFLLPIIGFSQNCENSILDEVLENENVNQYFQLALSFNISELTYLNNCDSETSYTMFVPGNSVPPESTAAILTLPGDLIDYISYYIHPESMNFLDFTNEDIEMIDGNMANISVAQSIADYNVMINQANITIQDICTCNGVIHIIDDLIWANNNTDIQEHTPITHYYNPFQQTITINPNLNSGQVKIIDISGKVVNLKDIVSYPTIDISNLNPGVYFISYTDEKNIYNQKILIN